MNVFVKVMGILARAVSDRLLGEKRTDELVAVFREYRETPSVATGLPLQRIDPGAIAESAVASLETVSEQQRIEVATLVASAAPLVEDLLLNPALTPETVVARVLENFPDKRGSKYIVWLDAPPLTGRPCFVLFNWDKPAKEGGTSAFSVRDFVNGRFYYGHHQQSPRASEGLPEVLDWRRYAAAEVWGLAKCRVKCGGGREGTDFPVTHESRWKTLLEQRTEDFPGSVTCQA